MVQPSKSALPALGLRLTAAVLLSAAVAQASPVPRGNWADVATGRLTAPIFDGAMSVDEWHAGVVKGTIVPLAHQHLRGLRRAIDCKGGAVHKFVEGIPSSFGCKVTKCARLGVGVSCVIDLGEMTTFGDPGTDTKDCDICLGTSREAGFKGLTRKGKSGVCKVDSSGAVDRDEGTPGYTDTCTTVIEAKLSLDFSLDACDNPAGMSLTFGAYHAVSGKLSHTMEITTAKTVTVGVPGLHYAISVPAIAKASFGPEVAVTISGNADNLGVLMKLQCCGAGTLLTVDKKFCLSDITGLDKVFPFKLIDETVSFGDFCKTSAPTAMPTSTPTAPPPGGAPPPPPPPPRTLVTTFPAAISAMTAAEKVTLAATVKSQIVAATKLSAASITVTINGAVATATFAAGTSKAAVDTAVTDLSTTKPAADVGGTKYTAMSSSAPVPVAPPAPPPVDDGMGGGWIFLIVLLVLLAVAGAAAGALFFLKKGPFASKVGTESMYASNKDSTGNH